jgi:hypothetical protein
LNFNSPEDGDGSEKGMVEIVVLMTVIVEEILVCVWLCERERDLLRVMTERMVRRIDELEQEVRDDEQGRWKRGGS